MSILEEEQQIVRKYLNVRYSLRGRSLESGLDCYGLIIAVYADLGHQLLDIEGDYDPKGDWEKKTNFIESYHDQWLKSHAPFFIDVVLFKDHLGHVNHAGVMLRHDRFLHCNRTGVSVGRILFQEWEKKVDGFYHLKARDAR